jgi:hypothetical protein
MQLKRWIVTGCLLIVAAPVTAQDGMSVRGDSLLLKAVVTYLTSDYVYIGIGRDHGVHNGDTLYVVGPRLTAGRLRISGTARARSLTTFVGTPFDVRVGDTLNIRLPLQEVVGRDEGVTAAADSAEGTADPLRRGSILSRTNDTTRESPVRRNPIRISGRIRADVNGLRTVSEWRSDVVERSVRTFATPSTSVRLLIADLPGGWNGVVDARISRRYSTRSIVTPNSIARLYRISVQRTNRDSPIDVEMGRFPVRQDPARTYWDGIRGAYRTRDLLAGIALGLEPDRYNGFVQTDVPKAVAFVEMTTRPGAWRLSTTVSAAHVQPSNGWLNHTYFGLEQDVRFKPFRGSGEMQLDRDPEGGGWTASRLTLRGSAMLPGGLSMTARYRDRRPYGYYRTTNIIGTRRTQRSLSVQWGRPGMSAFVSWTAATAEASVRSDSWTGSVRLTDTPLWHLGFTASAGIWSRASSDSRYVTLSVLRPIPGGRLSLTWQHYAFTGGLGDSQTDTIRLNAILPVVNRLVADASVRVQAGNRTSGLGGQVGLTYSF